jgi:C-terminal processing protease CtpA/Prc
MFWTYMDEHYVYFDEKKLNWDSLYKVYSPRVKSLKNEDELDSVFQNILNQWSDYHVNIQTTKNSYITNSKLNHKYNEQSPVVEKYNFENYKYKTNEFYVVQNRERPYAYMKIETFEFSFYKELSLAMNQLSYDKGLIIDLRKCNGGNLENSVDFVSLFFNGEKTLFFKQPKTGKGKSDFGNLEPVKYIGLNIINAEIPLIVIADSSAYSAPNLCAFILGDFLNTTVVGTNTGGGGSPTFTVLLPNGWKLTYPYLKLFSVSGKNMEYGLYPDVYHNFISPRYSFNKRDDHIAIAMELLDSINNINGKNGYNYFDYKNMYQDHN